MGIEEQLNRIFNKHEYIFNTPLVLNHSDKYIYDVYDGKNYKNVYLEEEGIKERKAFTFLLNTDGIALSDKSNCSIWPAILIINELPIGIRFSIENVVIAGNLINIQYSLI